MSIDTRCLGLRFEGDQGWHLMDYYHYRWKRFPGDPYKLFRLNLHSGDCARRVKKQSRFASASGVFRDDLIILKLIRVENELLR